MNVLDRKLLRDLMRLWAQVLAIALVLAAGVAALVLSNGAQNSLRETRDAYYDRYRFADVFAAATRAPMEAALDIAAIDGVAMAEPRIYQSAILDVPGLSDPATGTFISLPRKGRPRLNDHFLRSGRIPDADSRDQVLANETFVKAHGFTLGSTFTALLNGKKRSLTIVGVMMSPEFIYVLGPGDLVPDDRRFGVFAMPYDALAAAYDLDGAFNNITVRLLHGASEPAVIRAIDLILERFGGVGAYGRDDHQSDAFLQAELDQFEAMSYVIPPIFLVVAAFLVNITIARLIALEREQIGLMKAVGYSTTAVAMHYLKLVALIALIGIVLGWIGGWFLGRDMAETFSQFYHFPFLIFLMRPEIFVISGAAALIAALGGALKAVLNVVRLPPAVAMSPPAPPRYRHLISERLGLLRRGPMALTMAMRNISRWPVRAAMTTLGLAASVAVLIGSMFAHGSLDFMIDASFVRAERQDATISFVDERHPGAEFDVAALPGVMRVEPYRLAPVRLRHGHLKKRTALYGKPPDPELSRVLDAALQPVSPPDVGIALTETLAEIIGASRGDLIDVKFLTGRREVVQVPVTSIIRQYVGLAAYIDIGALNRLLRAGDVIDGVHISYDAAAEPDLFDAVKATPLFSGIALQRRSLEMFRATVAENISMMTTVYTTLAAIIGFGVVYNSVRIQLSERARELASLRVLGFTRGETSMILLGELMILGALAIPLGWLLGYGLAWLVTLGLQSELFRVPLVVTTATYAWATLVFLLVASASALVVRRRVDRLDLITVLKTRD